MRRVENRSELDGWDSVAFGMALDMDRGRWVLRLSGDADASVATAIDKALRGAVLHADDGRDLDVELADVTYLDGHVVGVLLGISAELRAQGRAFAMVAPSALAARLLGILGLDRLLDIRSDEQGQRA